MRSRCRFPLEHPFADTYDAVHLIVFPRIRNAYFAVLSIKKKPVDY